MVDIHHLPTFYFMQEHYIFQVSNMSQCRRRNVSCWQYWISWTAFVEIYYYTEHTSCLLKYLCDIMIGLTCSWAWSTGPTLSPPPPLCVLTFLIAEGGGGEEGSWTCHPLFSFSLFFPPVLSLSISLSLPPFIDDQPVSSSCRGRLWKLCMWLSDTHCFPPWKLLFSSTEGFIRHLWSATTTNPNWGFVFGGDGEDSLDFASVRSVALLWNSLHWGTWCNAAFLRSRL